MNPQSSNRVMARRQFLGSSTVGIGAWALASVLDQHRLFGRGLTHMAPTAKSVIYLFMAGGPSHLDLFDYKPKLMAMDGQPVPEKLIAGQRFAFLKGIPSLGGTPWKFGRHGQAGTYVSELLPNIAGIVDDITVIRSMYTEQFNHDPAVTFINSGSPIPGRPSMGSWLSYGLGGENQNFPAFVVLISGAGTQPLQSRYWGSGFLPSNHQGVQFRSQGDPVLFLSNPPGLHPDVRRDSLDAIRALNQIQLEAIGDPEISARIEAFELAYRMQMSVPDMMDITREPKCIQEMYGIEPGKISFANNCLLARRLIEQGVRFVQLYHTGWDHHGGTGKQNLVGHLPIVAKEIDAPAAALIKDLKSRGLLDETLVVWGGEFGRTPMIQGEVTAHSMGRDHHPRSFAIWMAGGGIKAGCNYGQTDELGYDVTEGPVHVHDFQATVLHCLGIDHQRLTFKFQGRQFRLTDVHGTVVDAILA